MLGIQRKEKATGKREESRFTRRLSVMGVSDLLDWADTTGSRIAFALTHLRQGRVEPEIGLGEAAAQIEILSAVVDELRARHARGVL